MSLKTAIRKAINENSKYTYIKMYKPEVSDNFDGTATMFIEIDIKKKRK